MRVAAAFVNTTPLDWDGNLRACSLAMALARGEGAQVALLPELCLTGYGCEDAFLSADLRKRALNSLKKICAQTEGLIAVVGLPFEYQGALYNCAAVIADGELAALIPKQNLALDGIHYEPRWFTPWMAGRREQVELFGKQLPLGDWIIKAGDAVIGLEICHDAWVKDRPCHSLKARGANLILCPSASHFALGKLSKREALVTAATQQGLAYAYSNLMGNEAGRVIYDGGAMIADASGIVARGERFSYKAAGVVCVDLVLQAGKAGDGFVELKLPSLSRAGDPPAPTRTLTVFEEFGEAAALGLCDYLRKSNAKGYVLSLSGGADSAACAVLVDMARKNSGNDIALTCVYQATENSSNVTLEAARGVAAACGAKFYEFDISGLLKGYTELVEGALGRKLSWESDDATLQNLQARVRSPGIWGLANALGSLLIATNNRSEGAAGYTTMDGDTSGGLAPIAGIGKHFLRQWLISMEKSYPALKAVNAQAPTAELRPPSAAQTDESDLMPYEALDCIERLASVDGFSPLEAFEAAAKAMPEFKPSDIGNWVIRFYQLFSRNQWKRERLAPSFHLDDHNLDPRSWRRFPILSGNYEAELAELRAALK